MSAGDASAQRSSLTDEMLLADELLEVPRAHAGSQWLTFGRWLEEGLGSCAGEPSGGWHGPMVAPRWASGTGSLDEAEPGQVDDEPEREKDKDQAATDDRDPLHVAGHVGVFLGGGDLDARGADGRGVDGARCR